MTAESKIAEVERWFEKIKQSYPNNRLELQDNLNAFLNAISSIPDHLLEEYNIKFSLAIPLNATSFRQEFDKKISKSDNRELLSFYLWFKVRRKFVEKRDRISAILYDKRHINTHRFISGPTINSVQLHFPMPRINPPLPPYVKPGSKVYKIHTKNPKPKTTKFTIQSDPPILDLFFEELREEANVIDACKHMLETMKNLVIGAHEKFPIS